MLLKTFSEYRQALKNSNLIFDFGTPKVTKKPPMLKEGDKTIFSKF